MLASANASETRDGPQTVVVHPAAGGKNHRRSTSVILVVEVDAVNIRVRHFSSDFGWIRPQDTTGAQ